jgi:hypothetical protein
VVGEQAQVRLAATSPIKCLREHSLPPAVTKFNTTIDIGAHICAITDSLGPALCSGTINGDYR